MMKILSASATLLLALLPASTAQEAGTEVCSCAPNTYEFTLDFSLFCPPVNITLGDAVQATSCLVSPFGNPDVEDLIPIAVQSIDILELGQDLRVLVQENIEGNFGDGDTFSYTSISADPANINSAVDIPRALQLNLVGVNANDEPIINVYIITFTNDCGTYPVLQEGQSAGWTRFSDLGPPDREYCPLAPAPVETPSPTASSTTVAPTTGATSAVPSDVPSFAPTAMDSEFPSDIPSLSPSVFPTVTPVVDETLPPVASPTDAPVAPPPTDAPITAAPITPAPTDFSMSMAMSMDFSMSMVRMALPEADDLEIDIFEMEFGVPKRASDTRKGVSLTMKSAKSSKSGRSSKSDKTSKSGKDSKSAESSHSAKASKSSKSRR